MSTNFLFTQSPNRKGNQSKHTPTGVGGVTAQTNTKHGVAQPTGSQGAPKAGGSITGQHQKVQVSRPKADYCANDGYRSSSYTK